MVTASLLRLKAMVAVPQKIRLIVQQSEHLLEQAVKLSVNAGHNLTEIL